MPKIKVSQSTGQLRDKLGKFTKKLEEGKEAYLEALAQKAISRSPVDSGTYITSHEITTSGGASGVTSSKGKPTNQPYEPFAEEGLSILRSDIASLPESSNQVVMSNKAEHAQKVEDDYGVYAEVRREAARLAEEIFNDL